MNTETVPSARHVRQHYRNQGYECRVHNDGRVEFRKPGGPWLDGRNLSEYRVRENQIVLI